MKVFYRDENVIVYQGDSAPLIQELQKDKSVLCLTDPPYGVGLNTSYGRRGGAYPMGPKTFPRVIGDSKPFDPAPLLHFERAVIFGGDHFHHLLPPSGQWLIWDKRRGVVPPRCQADCELAWSSREGPARIFRHLWDGFLRDSERGQKRIHPTQKPIELFRWIISFFPETEVVFDPYMGSGSSLIAAKELKLKAIGVEISPDYCAAAVERLTRKERLAA